LIGIAEVVAYSLAPHMIVSGSIGGEIAKNSFSYNRWQLNKK
jgi:hypothetical protein